jgi:acyl carrier protein
VFPLQRSDLRYELELHIWEDDRSGGYGGRFIYDSSLYRADTMEHWTACYLALLEAFTESPAAAVSGIELPAGDAGTGTEAGLFPELAWPVEEPADQHAPPSGPTEIIVHGIWAELLHIDDIGIHDSFFDVGGHSFLAALMIGKIRAALGVSLSIQELFGEPTIAAIARAVDARSG